MTRTAIAVAQQLGIAITCRDTEVGAYFGALLVEDSVLIELRASVRWAAFIAPNAAGILGLLMDFGTPLLEIRRVVVPS